MPLRPAPSTSIGVSSRPRRVGRGHEHPLGKKKGLRNGRDAGDAVGFGILGLWVRRGSYANRRRLRGVVSLSHAIAPLEAGKSSGWPWPIRHSGAVTELEATFDDPLNQKDQGVHACLQGTDTIDKLIGAIFKPRHPGFKRTRPVDQAAFERDNPAIQTRNVVLQAVQSPPDGL
jgi:hypothetical protein